MRKFCKKPDVCEGLAPLTAVAKPCLGMHKLCNICSSSMYDKCVWFASVQGKMPLTPQKRVPKLAIVWYFFADERPWCRQFDID